MINWKKGGVATSVIAWLLIGPIIFIVILFDFMSVINKYPTFFITLTYILFLLCVSLLIYSKIPSILFGNYITFGSKNVVSERKIYYKASYVFLGISILLAFSIVLAIEFNRL